VAKYRLISVGIWYPEIEYTDFNSDVSLTDYDVVIINPLSVLEMMGVKLEYDNIYNVVGTDARLVLSTIQRRKSEFSAILKSGKIVITFTTPPFILNYRYSGHGGHFNTYSWISDFLPSSAFYNLQKGTGRGLKLIDKLNLFSNYYFAFKGDLIFNAYIDEVSAEYTYGDVFISNSVDQVVGFSISLLGGVIAFLPEYEKNSQADEKFVGVISHIAKNYFGAYIRSERPPWTNEYTVPGIEELDKEIEKVQTQISDLEEHKSNLIDSRTSLDDFKALLYEKGDILKDKVVETLCLLGFNAETVVTENTDFDVVFESSEGRAIAEVEGKDNDAIQKEKIDQLISAISQDFETSNNFAKGVLFGNPYRLKKPDERDSPFTETVIRLSQKFDYALITTAELYNVAIYLLENPKDEEYKRACREAILSSAGFLSEFPKSD
jgi:hypothetical protein